MTKRRGSLQEKGGCWMKGRLLPRHFSNLIWTALARKWSSVAEWSDLLFSLRHLLKVKQVPNLPINLPRIVIVKSPERKAVIQQSARVRNIRRIHRHRKILPKRLPHCHVRRHVSG